MARCILKAGLIGLFLWTVFHPSPRPAFAIDFDKPIKAVRIEGNKRANTNTILFYIRSKVGGGYNVQMTREDIKKIYSLGYFDDILLEVEEDPDGMVLVYVVKEKPFVRSVKITGNSEVQEKDISNLLELKKGNFFQKHLVKKDVAKIKKRYLKKGFYFTEVEVTTEAASNNQVDVTYRIEERQRVKIGKVVFKGNKFFRGDQLAEQIESKGATFWSMFSDSGNYQKEILKTDLLRLESYYRDAGFIKAHLEDPRVEVDKENAIIVITMVVHEGDQYMVGEVTAEGDEIHSTEEIMNCIKLSKGKTFNQSLFRQSLFKVTDLYSNDGYAYANALPDMKEHPESKTVDLNVKVDRGPLVYLGRINITGNYKTADNVIRREFRLLEGERFSAEKLSRTRQRIQNTGFFSTVDMEQKTGVQKDLMDLDVNVNEKETGQIRAGVGYSSLENMMLQAQVSENNIFGTGRSLAVGVESSTLRQDYFLNFTEPRFRDRDIQAGFSVYSHQYDFISYTRFSKGASLSLGRAISEYTNANIGYKLEGVNVRLNVDPSTVGMYLRSQTGLSTTSALTLGLTKDMRDNAFNPTTGYKVDFSTECAGGPLGAQNDFVKLTLGASRYFPLPYGFVFMAHGDMKFSAPYGGQKLPLFEHFFLGGPTTLRGFNFTDVGPLDSTGDAIGGDSTLLFNVEVSYNFTDAIQGVIFYDRGQVYGDVGDLSKTTSNRFDITNMRHSVGWGMRFTTPMMPIWLAWGFKLDQRPGETPMEFHFTMGQTF